MILKNKIYIGVLEQGKRKKVNYKLDKVVDRPETEWSVTENRHEAIISRTDFDTVLYITAQDRTFFTARFHPSYFLFRNFSCMFGVYFVRPSFSKMVSSQMPSASPAA